MIFDHAMKMLPIITKEILDRGGKMAPFGTKDEVKVMRLNRSQSIYHHVKRMIACHTCLEVFETTHIRQKHCMKCRIKQRRT